MGAHYQDDAFPRCESCAQPDVVRCSLPKGHDGPHSTGGVYCRWSAEGECSPQGDGAASSPDPQLLRQDVHAQRNADRLFADLLRELEEASPDAPGTLGELLGLIRGGFPKPQALPVLRTLAALLEAGQPR